MHEGDARARRGSHRHRSMRLAINDDRACIGLDEATDDLHQRRLACAILPDETQHLARLDVDADVVECQDAGIAFAYPGQAEQRFGHAKTDLSFASYLCSSCFRVATKSATLPWLMTRVGMMICLLAGMNDLSPLIYLIMSIID